jgi:hypothetical protein
LNFDRLNRRPHITVWHDRLRERRSYRDTFDAWPNQSYYTLMKEKGLEALATASKRFSAHPN